MSYFRYIAFMGAACLLLTMFPDKTGASLDYASCLGAAASLFWGGLYFLIRVDEYFYGVVAVIFAVLVQPLFPVPFDDVLWLICSILAAAFLVLAGLLCINLEKRIAYEKAKYIRTLEEQYRAQDDVNAIHPPLRPR